MAAGWCGEHVFLSCAWGWRCLWSLAAIGAGELRQGLGHRRWSALSRTRRRTNAGSRRADAATPPRTAAIDSGEDVHDAGTSETAPEDGASLRRRLVLHARTAAVEPGLLAGRLARTDCCEAAPGTQSCDADERQRSASAQHDPSWCNNRCGTITDNCGAAVRLPGATAATAWPADAHPCETPAAAARRRTACDNPVNCGNSGDCCDTEASACTAGRRAVCRTRTRARRHCGGRSERLREQRDLPGDVPERRGVQRGHEHMLLPAAQHCTRQRLRHHVTAPCGAVAAMRIVQQRRVRGHDVLRSRKGAAPPTNCEDTCGVFQSACCHDSGPTCIGSAQPCGAVHHAVRALSCQAGECAPIPTTGVTARAARARASVRTVPRCRAAAVAARRRSTRRRRGAHLTNERPDSTSIPADLDAVSSRDRARGQVPHRAPARRGRHGLGRRRDAPAPRAARRAQVHARSARRRSSPTRWRDSSARRAPRRASRASTSRAYPTWERSRAARPYLVMEYLEGQDLESLLQLDGGPSR